MTRLRRLVRPGLDVHFCGDGARVEVCDATCFADRGRESATARAQVVGVRL